MGGIAITTAALIIVLSVFNGLEGLLRSLYSSFDPEIKIEATRGKTFVVTDSLVAKVKATPGVAIVTEVIEDYAYVRYRDSDIVVTIKGVSDNFIDQHRLDTHIDEGRLVLRDNGVNYAIVGRGVKYALSIASGDDFDMLQVFYIKNLKATATLDPSKVYTQRNIRPGAVFSIEKNYDENFIFMPLEFVRDLAGYDNRRTALEVKTTDSLSSKSVQKRLKERLGSGFSVLSNEEQHKDLYRLLNIEKLFGFLAMSLLIMLVSINIFFSLMMLTLDKKKDISVISAMGGSQSLVLNIFLQEGALISFIGAGSGLILGGFICWLQDRVGLVGMGMENAVVSDYPVELRWTDFALTAGVIIVLTFLVSIYPAYRASRIGSAQQL